MFCFVFSRYLVLGVLVNLVYLVYFRVLTNYLVYFCVLTNFLLIKSYLFVNQKNKTLSCSRIVSLTQTYTLDHLQINQWDGNLSY